MPTLTDRENGVTVSVLKGTHGNIILKTSSSYYRAYSNLRADDTKIMDAILQIATTNTNHFVASGQTLQALVDISKYSQGAVQNALVRLNELHLISRTNKISGEYIVNPLFAIKGSECAVWQFIQAVECGNGRDSAYRITCEDLVLTANY